MRHVERCRRRVCVSAQLVLFVKGALIGFALAAPVGPIALLCIHRTMSNGRVSGLVSGLGAATADAFYGLVAALSLTIISGFVLENRAGIQLFGGGVLCVLGVRTYLSRPAEKTVSPRWHGLLGAYCSALLLTLTNPMTLLAFAAIFASVGVEAARWTEAPAWFLVAGVFIGSFLWWSILVIGAGALRGRFSEQRLRGVNRFAGGFILAVGILYLAMSRT
jgi:threonine/homoserine/homoserine lactone efflux protein